MKGTLKVTSALLLILLLALPFLSSCVYMSGETLEVALVPRIQTFEAAPSVINGGTVTYLSWQVAGADAVSINNGVGDVATSGTTSISPGSTTLYTLTASNMWGEATASTQVVVNDINGTLPAPSMGPPPVIAFFHADRASILPGELVSLSWNIRGATGIAIAPYGQVSAEGTVQVSPIGTTTYVLNATNSFGTATAVLTVSVGQLSPVARTVTLYPDPFGSGSLVKGAGYFSYARYGSVCAGDTQADQASRAFLSFDISSIPRNAVIQESHTGLKQLYAAWFSLICPLYLGQHGRAGNILHRK